MTATGSAREFLERTTIRELVDMPQQALDECLSMAYRLYSQGRFAQAEVMCRGLVAADHRYWYAHALLAATLQKLGRFREALAEVDEGLRHEPGNDKLLAQRAHLERLVAALAKAKAHVASLRADAARSPSSAGPAGRAPAQTEAR
jgi:tetratricopeptide (TPR) repeat protein